jgi:hypothetical protein
MKFRFILFLLALILSFIQFSFAQLELNLYGNGARAAGMGYAFTGLADDATAISWNPAGLTQLTAMEASVVARFGFGSLSTNYTQYNPTTKVGSAFNLNFASFVFPFKAGEYNLVGGLAYRRMFDFTKNWTVTIDEQDVFIESKTDNKGGIDAISPALGFQLSDMISIGATFNFLMGSTDYKSSYRQNIYGSTYQYDDKYSEKYKGTAIELGALIKPSPQVSIGGNFKIPTTVTVDEDNYSYEVGTPFWFDLGAAFLATNNLTLAVDYRFRNWEDVELRMMGQTIKLYDYYKSQYGESVNFSGNSLHAGLEYLVQNGDNVIPLRLGYFQYPNLDFDYNNKQIALNGLTAGVGLIMGKVILDGAFEWAFGSYPYDEENGSIIDYKINEFKISIGAVIHLDQK